jgi:hypothetical protein
MYKIKFQYTQIGIYTEGREPNFFSWFPTYDVRKWQKSTIINRWLIWTNSVPESFETLRYVDSVFERKRVVDDPFIFIMLEDDAGNEAGFDVITISDDKKYQIKHHPIK